MAKRNVIDAMVQSYGDVPDLTYFPGDMADIRAYFDYMQAEGDGSFLMDDATWDDLNMDAVFKRMNIGLSNSGEQYLYYLLRTPAQTRAEFDRRKELIALMEHNRDLRQKLYHVLGGPGRRSGVNVFGLLELAGSSRKNLLLYIGLGLGLIASVVLTVLTLSPTFLLLTFGMVAFNGFFHTRRRGEETWKINTLQYCSAMVSALKKLCGMGEEFLKPYLEDAAASLEQLKQLRGLVTNGGADMLVELLSTFFFLDLISFERKKNDLVRHRREFLKMNEILGRLDAAICVASYRKSVPAHVVPELDFEGGAPHLCCRELVHPLIDRCVPNSVDMRASLLLTGSNASGKTTFLRTLAINLSMAQGVCTALGTEFGCTPFRVFTSIDIRDNLATGDSYYVAELKSLHKVVDAAREEGHGVFCCLDEIFRGTNAVERISASAEILTYLEGRCLCAAATHDVELCAILKQFDLYHFEEQIEDGEMFFDYQLKPGYSQTSNAIKLLELMGFPPDVVRRAQQRAVHYLEKRDWGGE